LYIIKRRQLKNKYKCREIKKECKRKLCAGTNTRREECGIAGKGDVQRYGQGEDIDQCRIGGQEEAKKIRRRKR
jgi:hypothetical protein